MEASVRHLLLRLMKYGVVGLIMARPNGEGQNWYVHVERFGNPKSFDSAGLLFLPGYQMSSENCWLMM